MACCPVLLFLFRLLGYDTSKHDSHSAPILHYAYLCTHIELSLILYVPQLGRPSDVNISRSISIHFIIEPIHATTAVSFWSRNSPH